MQYDAVRDVTFTSDAAFANRIMRAVVERGPLPVTINGPDGEVLEGTLHNVNAQVENIETTKPGDEYRTYKPGVVIVSATFRPRPSLGQS